MRRAPRAAVIVTAACFVLLSTIVASADPPATDPTSTDMVNDTVRAIVQTGNDVWLGGAFTEVLDEHGNNLAPAGGLAAFNDSGQLDTSITPPTFTNSTGPMIIYGLSVAPDGGLYVAGSFDAANGLRRRNVAEVDPATGALLPFSPGSGTAFSILATASAIYVGGSKLLSFQPTGGATPGWTSPELSTDPSIRAHTTEPNVRRIIEFDNTLVIACQCDSITDSNGSHPTKAIAQIDPDTGDLTSWVPGNMPASSAAFGIDVLVHDFPGTSTPTIYLAAGGNDFTAAYNFDSGHQVWREDTSGSSQAIQWFQDDLIVGGHFDWTQTPTSSTCGDHDKPNTDCYLSPHLVAMDPSSGHIILENGVPWNPVVCCIYDGVWTLLADANGTTLHVGGAFRKFGTGTWTYDASSPNPYTSSPVPGHQDFYVRLDAPLPAQNLSVGVGGSGTGVVTSDPAGISCPSTCSANFGGNDTVTLDAEATNGSTFTGWGGDCTGTGSCTVVMSAARSVTATFSSTPPRQLTVTKAGTGGGTVTSSPAGISCGATCSATFANGTMVTLTATPDGTSTFAGWSGACSGTGTCAVTMNAAHAVTATFSPKSVCGDILFVSGRAGNGDIYSMNANGTGVTDLTNNVAADANPAWSPDCRQIAFASRREGETWHIFVMNADGSGVHQVTTGAGNDTQPTWAPGGKRLAFVSDRAGNKELYAINASGSGLTRITNNTVEDVQPDWSPQGDRIVFASNRFGVMDLFTIAPDGSHRARLTDGARATSQPTWSPSGGRIAFISYASGAPQVWTVAPDGTRMVRLTHDGAVDGHPSWSPAGDRIAFSSTRSGNAEIWTIGAHGVGSKNLTLNVAKDTSPSWS